MTHLRLIFLVLLALFTVSACGGGGGGSGAVAEAGSDDNGDNIVPLYRGTPQADVVAYCDTGTVLDAEKKGIQNIKNNAQYSNSGGDSNWAPLDSMCAAYGLYREQAEADRTAGAASGFPAKTAGKIGGDDVTVAVIDGYFDTDHTEFTNTNATRSYYNAVDDISTAASVDCKAVDDAIADSSGTQKACGTGDDQRYNSRNGSFGTAYFEGTDVASLIVGNKVDGDTTGFYGLAYNADLKMITISNKSTLDHANAATAEDTMSRAIRTAAGFDATGVLTAAQLGSPTNGSAVIQIRSTGSGSHQAMVACTKAGANGKFFHRGLGLAVFSGESGSCATSRTHTSVLGVDEADALKIALGTADPNKATRVSQAKSLIVVGTGDQGMNSETGMMWVYDTKADADANENGTRVAAKDTLETYTHPHSNLPLGSRKITSNIAGFYASLPVLDDNNGTGNPDWAESGVNYIGGAGGADYMTNMITQERWLAVVALDRENKIADFSNGCGLAARFCIAAPGVDIRTATVDGEYKTTSGTDVAAAFVSSALAQIQGTYPSLTDVQLKKLVLATATYIASDNEGGLATKDRCAHDVTKNYHTAADVNDTLPTAECNGGSGYDYNQVYGHGILNLRRAIEPVNETYAVGFNNVPLGALIKDTQINLANHFGSDVQNVKLGMKDYFERTFTTSAAQTMYQPIGVGLDDYMAGLLGSNQQTDSLGPQAQANYSNNGTQNWMNFEYRAGKSTAKVGFQDAYKVNPLQDSSTSILRANNIRPASTNIGMMDVDYEINGNISLSSYAARGEYDTGFKFDELGTDLDMRYNKSTLNLGVGHLREHDQFLGTNTTGAYAISAPSVSRFTDVTYGHDLGNTGKFNIYANYINYETEVDTVYDQFATIDGLQADQYQIGVKSTGILTADDGLDIALITKLGVTDGALNQNTVNGYTSAGEYNNVTQSYDLALQERHQQLEVTYQGKLYQNADKVSALSNNRFFTTLKIDRNLNNTQGLSQTEIITGMQAQF